MPARSAIHFGHGHDGGDGPQRAEGGLAGGGGRPAGSQEFRELCFILGVPCAARPRRTASYNQFDLRKVYGRRLVVDARIETRREYTSIFRRPEERHYTPSALRIIVRSGAAALAGAYVDQLNTLVSELSTSFRATANVPFSKSASKSRSKIWTMLPTTRAVLQQEQTRWISSQEGKAMLDAAGTIGGAEMIAAQNRNLRGSRQIYN